MTLVSQKTYKLFYLKGIGEIKLTKSPRAKRMNIRVKPFDGVIVTIPRSLSYKHAEEFAIEKADWIKNSLLKTSEYENKLTVFTERTVFNTRLHKLTIERWEKEILSVRVVNSKILVKYPEFINVRDEQIQTGIRRGIDRALKIEAIAYLPARTAYLAKKLGFKYRSLTINNTKSRWGCCTRDNNISLNLQLMRLPASLIDYVIIHELCHTEQKNHGRNFWNLMEKVHPGSIKLNKELKKYNTKIY